MNAYFNLRGGLATANVRGRDLMPLIKGAQLPGADDFLVTTIRLNPHKLLTPQQQAQGHSSVIVRRGPWKGIWHRDDDMLELYNIEDDPGEQINAADEYPELALAMKVFGRLWQQDCGNKAPMRVRERRVMQRLNR